MKSKAFSPTSSEVESHLKKVASKHPKLVRLETLGRTNVGRPLLAVTITDDKTSDDNKQNVLIIGGQHGSEESGRLVALTLIDWLVSPAGDATRRKQKIAVMPNVNPDGCEMDIYKTPDGVLPNLDHGPDGSVSPEGRAVEKLAYDLQPEVFVDLHAKGGSGYSHDMVLFPWSKEYTEDSNILHMIGFDMVKAGEKAGIPQVMHPLTWSGWGAPTPDGTSTTLFHYRNFKSIVFLLENSESNTFSYPASLRAGSGLAKLQALLAWGNRRYHKLPCAGYPNMLISEFFHFGLLAWGTTAKQRRASRIDAWRNITKFQTFKSELPIPPNEHKVILEYDGEPLINGLSIQVSAVGRKKVRSVSLNGVPLQPSRTEGWTSFYGPGGTYIVAAVKDFQPGRHELVFKY